MFPEDFHVIESLTSVLTLAIPHLLVPILYAFGVRASDDIHCFAQAKVAIKSLDGREDQAGFLGQVALLELAVGPPTAVVTASLSEEMTKGMAREQW